MSSWLFIRLAIGARPSPINFGGKNRLESKAEIRFPRPG